MGLLYCFLCVEVNELNNGDLTLSQSKYTQEVLARAQMEQCKSSHYSMFSLLILNAHLVKTLFQQSSFYDNNVETLQYIILTDLIFLMLKTKHVNLS